MIWIILIYAVVFIAISLVLLFDKLRSNNFCFKEFKKDIELVALWPVILIGVIIDILIRNGIDD